MQDDVHFNVVFKKRGKKSLETTKTEELLQVGETVQRWHLWLWCGRGGCGHTRCVLAVGAGRETLLTQGLNPSDGTALSQ